MPHRNVYHIVTHEDGWAARLQGAPTPSATAPTRAEALESAAEILRLLGNGRVVVHGDDGRIEHSYSLETLESADERRARARRWAWAAGVLGVAFVGGLAVARRR